MAEPTPDAAVPAAAAAAVVVQSRVRLLELTAEPLSVDRVLAAVADPAAGGTAVFVGTVRDHDHDHDDDGGSNRAAERSVRSLSYEAHPSAPDVLAEVAARVCDTVPVRAMAAAHRTGELGVGEISVVVAVAADHRAEAFAAARLLIDELKARVPIWKQQVYADGAANWVGMD